MNFLSMSGGEWGLVVFILALVLGARGVPAVFGWVAGLASKKG
jgi:Sec-independent protein translocase protein TatA